MDKENPIYKSIDTLPKKKTYQEKIKNNKLNSYTTRYEKEKTTTLTEGIQEKYNKLLENKVDDVKIKNMMITKAEQLIKNRIEMWVGCKDTKIGIGGSFRIQGILPEDEIIIYELCYGRTLQSNDWYEMLKEIERTLIQAKRPPIGINNEIAPPTKMTITEIIIQVTMT